MYCECIIQLCPIPFYRETKAVVVPKIFIIPDTAIFSVISDSTMFNCANLAQSISEDNIFDYFVSCMDMSFNLIEYDIKSYSTLTVIQEQIIINQGSQTNINYFSQWYHNDICIGQNPSLQGFPMIEVITLINKNNNHKTNINKSKSVTEAENPPL